MTRIIEIATMHANSWGVGYARLIADNQGWVLSRVTIEMERYPQVNEEYTITTWIEDYNRHFSQRNMEFRDKDGAVIGYARTIWMVINFSTRESVDISKLSYISENISPHPCPIAPQGRLRPIVEGKVTPYTFGYVDCDINRHVNTVRFLDLLLNVFTLERYDTHMISRLEIAFVKEARYGEAVDVVLNDATADDCLMSINGKDGVCHVKARVMFKQR